MTIKLHAPEKLIGQRRNQESNFKILRQRKMKTKQAKLTVYAKSNSKSKVHRDKYPHSKKGPNNFKEIGKKKKERN